MHTNTVTHAQEICTRNFTSQLAQETRTCDILFCACFFSRTSTTSKSVHASHCM